MNDDGVRFTFINYSTTDVATVSVTTSDGIVYKELLASTPVQLPAGNLQRMDKGNHALVVPPGRLCGFSTDKPATVTAVSGKLTILVAGGKDPWPQPPPVAAPPALAAAADWAVRFANFNTASGVDPARPARAESSAGAARNAGGNGASKPVPGLEEP